jgi:kynurenine formamidase
MPDRAALVNTEDARQVEWRLAEVTSPRLARPVPVVAAKEIPYMLNANRLQNLSIYLPRTPETSSLVGTPASFLPGSGSEPGLTRYHVHIHGGAWRDPQLTSASIEPAVAHAFSASDVSAPVSAVASINYTVSPFSYTAPPVMARPPVPYDPIKDNHSDPAREAIHPQHVSDVLHGLARLRSFGLTDGSYVLSGHSCGACIAFQAILQAPRYYGLGHLPDAPCPAALLGLNGLYDLPGLVNGLGASHEHLRDDYEMLLSSAFGADQDKWPGASPARFEPEDVAGRARSGKAPRLVVLDQSAEDQLVPMNQLERIKANLASVSGLRVVEVHRCTGKHATPWEQGVMIWESLQDTFRLLQEEK